MGTDDCTNPPRVVAVSGEELYPGIARMPGSFTRDHETGGAAHECTRSAPHTGPCNGLPRQIDGGRPCYQPTIVSVVTDSDPAAIHQAAQDAVEVAEWEREQAVRRARVAANELRVHRIRQIQVMLGDKAGICETCEAIVADTVAHREWHVRCGVSGPNDHYPQGEVNAQPPGLKRTR